MNLIFLNLLTCFMSQSITDIAWQMYHIHSTRMCIMLSFWVFSFYPCLDLLKFHFYKMCLVEDLFCLGIVGLLKLVDS